jgi:DNA-binding beta-propeller fold protein YncE
VADYENRRVQKFDSAGTFIVAWEMGRDIKTKGTPEAIAVDANGHVYITDYAMGRMQVFDNDGKSLWAWGGKTVLDTMFQRPVGIAFDGNGRIFVVNQSGNSVQVFNLP